MQDKPTIRKLVDAVLVTASDLEAFLIDYFEEVQKRASSDQDRTAKVNRLLLEIPADELLIALRKYDPLSFQKLSEFQRDNLDLQVNNPFQCWGTLAPDNITYVQRQSDIELAKKIHPHARISITGECQIGKSSLLKKAKENLPGLDLICYISFEDMLTHDCRIFHDRFFRRLSRELSQTVVDWDSFDSAVEKKRFAIFIDELGLLKDRETVEQFIPRLLRFCDTHNMSIVAAIPIPIIEYLDSVSLYNVKHRSGWTQITIVPFEIGELLQLLRLLPKKSREIAMQQIDAITRLSRCRPQSIQKLCHALYESEESGASAAVFKSIIMAKASY